MNWHVMKPFVPKSWCMWWIPTSAAVNLKIFKNCIPLPTLIIAFNKSDLYTDTEKQQLQARIQSRFDSTTQPANAETVAKPALIPQVVFIQSGGLGSRARLSRWP